jgi:hypothetical protein
MNSLPRPNYRPALSPRQLAALERERIKRIRASVAWHMAHDRDIFLDAVDYYKHAK